MPCSFRRSKASWMLGAIRRSTRSHEWMWIRSTWSVCRRCRLCLDRRDDLGHRRVVRQVAVGAAELRGEEDLVAAALHRLAEQRLGAGVGVVGRGVDVGDAALERGRRRRSRSRMRPEPSEMSDTMAFGAAEPAVRLDARRRPLRARAWARCLSTLALKMSRPTAIQPALRPTAAAAPPTEAATAAPPARSTARRVRAVGGLATKPVGDAGAGTSAHTGRRRRSAVATAAATQRRDRTPRASTAAAGCCLHALDDVVQERRRRATTRARARGPTARAATGRRTRSVRRVIRWPQRVQVIDRPPRRDLDSARRASAVLAHGLQAARAPMQPIRRRARPAGRALGAARSTSRPRGWST